MSSSNESPAIPRLENDSMNVRLARWVGVAYWALLTVVLLLPDPRGLLGLGELPGPPNHRSLHFLLFAALAFVSLAGRWPARGLRLAVMCMAYALLTEMAQLGIPGRSFEALDLFENVLGLAVGAWIWRWVRA